ncbi:2-hydroxyacid dehydrogenase [candidate division WOR-3 bacterium]|nr:2-hydroxyacid dehydrogenase [candidate division WOR-3 bacterium]
MRVAFFDAKPYDKDFFNEANKKYGYDIRYFQSRLSENNVIVTKDADSVCSFVNDTINKEVADELYNNGITLIALRSAGYNNVDLKAVFGRIHVVRVPAYSPNAVAEHTVGLMLSLNRKIHKAYYRTRDSNFNINGLLGFDMAGKTAGIIGTGKIGILVAKILKGFDMNVIAYDKFPDRDNDKKYGFTYVTLDTLYKESDIITLHCPLTPETMHIIDKSSVKKMKDGVMIINTGRGKLIDTVDLIAALKKGKVGSAGLDVYEEESEYFFEDYSSTIISDDVLARLLTFPNVLITSHQGFFTKEALRNIAETTLNNIKLYFEDNKLPNEICYRCSEYGSKEHCRKERTGSCF